MAPRPPYILAAPVPCRPVEYGGQLVAAAPFADVEARLTLMAEAAGLVAAPRVLSAQMGSTQAGNSVGTWDISADGSEGPLFVVGIDVPSRFADARLTMQSGGRKLCEGAQTRVRDALQLPVVKGEQTLTAPVIVARQDTLQISLDLTTTLLVPAEFAETDTVIVRAFVLRTRDGDPVADLADGIARAMLHEGEWYATSAAYTPTSGDNVSSQNVADDVIVQSIVLSAPSSVVEGAVTATRLYCTLGNYEVSPGGIALNGATEVWLPNCRYALRSGSRVRVRGDYPAGTPVAVRVCVIGRRVVGGKL